MSKVAERLVECFEYNADVKRVVFVHTSGEDYKFLSNLLHSLDVDEDMAYDEVQNALEAIAAEGLEVIEDSYYEYCEADIYTHDLLEWISRNLNNIAWCDEALSALGEQGSLVAVIQNGQCMAKEHIWRRVIEQVRELEEEEDDD